VFTEIVLDSHHSTLIAGENGAGKSTFIDALCFVLYNKSFRNVNKPTLLNSITQKNLLVEVEFEVNGQVNYLVRRGMRPNVFEIYKNEVLVPQKSSTGEYQDYLEKTVLKINFKSFIQIIILGAANYVPFMKLPAHARREVIEDLLDIQIFSIMNSLLKEKVNENRNAVQENDYQIDLIKNKIELAEQYIKNLKTNNQQLIEARKKKITDYEMEIAVCTEESGKLKTLLEAQALEIGQKQKRIKKLQKILMLAEQSRGKISKLQDDIDLYENIDNCPTCKQQIDATFREKALAEKRDTLTKLSNALKELEKDESLCHGLQDSLIESEKIFGDDKKKLTAYTVKIETYEQYIEEIERDINKIRGQATQLAGEDANVDSLRVQLQQLENAKEKLVNNKDLYQMASLLLKDGGIKGKIVKQYIPVMNKLINKYMEILDFFAEFHLNEQFEEIIKSRFRDEFAYESFSEGEKRRIDLSILFAWRELTKIRNSTTSNLIIFDEILDGSMDAIGIECFQNLLRKENTANIFVITHKLDQYTDKFENVLRFQKKKNFSYIV
jgi:DNA repair exonuclease SbcCD ATPase subunit